MFLLEHSQTGAVMRWATYLAYFFGGAFLVNAILHFVSGVSGRPFPSPFSSPPGQSESTAVVNVLWGSLYFVIAYLLLSRVGQFALRRWRDIIIVAVGGLLMAILLAQTFGQLYGGA